MLRILNFKSLWHLISISSLRFFLRFSRNFHKVFSADPVDIRNFQAWNITKPNELFIMFLSKASKISMIDLKYVFD